MTQFMPAEIKKCTTAKVDWRFDAMDKEMFAQLWEKAGFELVATGGGYWAEQKVVDGIMFKICDYHQTHNPDPSKSLEVSAYDAKSDEWLEFTQDVQSLPSALEKFPEWVAALNARIGK
ncbi:hypothetical protein ACEN2T_18225 [Pseudomonas sp. W22_MBD1_FP4]|uniref:hypothetical protein n=1 Tax=Pseudomonas sp. W22_MBD1_FP4 TaxID=3240272 RepID=UPI003F99C68E